jgi:hypothetical protein
MPTRKSLRRFSRNSLIAVVAVATVSMSTLALAGDAGATAAKSTTSTSTKKAAPKARRSDRKIRDTPAVRAAVRRMELRKAENYGCARTDKWMKYQKGLKARYAKRLVALKQAEAMATATRDSRKVVGLKLDIGRVETRQALNTRSKTVLTHDRHARKLYGWCKTRSAKAHAAKGHHHRRSDKAARARMRAAEAKAAEAKAKAAKAAKAAKSATKPKTTTTTKPTTSTTAPSTTTTKPTTTAPTKPTTSTTAPRTTTTPSSTPPSTSTSSPPTS